MPRLWSRAVRRRIPNARLRKRRRWSSAFGSAAGRVYGSDHDDPHPGPLPHRTYAALVGGPLDGLLLDFTGWRPEEVDDGVALMTEPGGGPVAGR
ncbi:hypothetical protein SRO_0373 [Streptomyces rochei]|nr:hypothetical protein SRO_0373 [Streptomyces rochei]